MTPVTVFHEMGGLAAQLLCRHLQAFAQAEGVEIAVHRQTMADLREPMMARVARGEAPDMMLVPSDFVAFENELRLSEIPDRLCSSDTRAEAFAVARDGQRLFGLPFLIGNNLVTYFNRALVKEPVGSIEEMVAMRTELPEGVFPLGIDLREPFWFASILGGLGGWFTDGDRTCLDTPEVIRALQLYAQFIDRGVLPRHCGDADINAGFQRGEYAYTLNGEWSYVDLEAAMGEHLGVQLLPTLEGRRLTSIFSAMLLVFPGNGLRGPREAVLSRLAQFLQSEAVQRSFAQEGNRIPVHRTAMAELQHGTDRNRMVLSLSLEQARPMPNNKATLIAWAALAQFLPSFVAGEVEAGSVAQAMQRYADDGWAHFRQAASHRD